MKSNFRCKHLDKVGHCTVFKLNGMCPFYKGSMRENWNDAPIICNKYDGTTNFEQISHEMYRYEITQGRNTTLELYDYEWEALKHALNSNRTGMYFDGD